MFFDHIYGFWSGALERDWTEVSIPTDVVGELLLDMVFTLFGNVDMQLPFLPVIAATDASTVLGHGDVVAQASVDDVRAVARKACKSGSHVSFDDGPELPDDLLARLGPRHNLNLDLGSFDVIFSVRIETPPTTTSKPERGERSRNVHGKQCGANPGEAEPQVGNPPAAPPQQFLNDAG